MDRKQAEAFAAHFGGTVVDTQDGYFTVLAVHPDGTCVETSFDREMKGGMFYPSLADQQECNYGEWHPFADGQVEEIRAIIGPPAALPGARK